MIILDIGETDETKKGGATWEFKPLGNSEKVRLQKDQESIEKQQSNGSVASYNEMISNTLSEQVVDVRGMKRRDGSQIPWPNEKDARKALLDRIDHEVQASVFAHIVQFSSINEEDEKKSASRQASPSASSSRVAEPVVGPAQ